MTSHSDPRPMHEEVVCIRVRSRAPIPGLADLIASRAWSIDKVVTAEIEPASSLALRSDLVELRAELNQ